LQSSLSALHGNALLLDSESGDSNLVRLSDRIEEQFKHVNRKVNSIRATTDTPVTVLTTANTINTGNIRRDIESVDLSLQAIPGGIATRFNPILGTIDQNVTTTMQALNAMNQNVTSTTQALPNSTAAALTPFIVNNNTDEATQKLCGRVAELGRYLTSVHVVDKEAPRSGHRAFIDKLVYRAKGT